MALETARPERYYQVDLFRFGAALGVMFYHYAFFGHAAHLIPQSYPGMVDIAKYGYLCIDLFFTISGYVILFSSWGRSPADFLAARFTRLYPLFWACLLLTFIVIKLAGNPEYSASSFQLLANTTMVPRLLGQDYIEGTYWSLFVELRFYFWVFVLLILKQMHRLDCVLAGWLVLTAIDLTHPIGPLEAAFALDWSHYFIAGAVFFRVKQGGWTKLRAGLITGSYIIALLNAISRPDKWGDYRGDLTFSIPIIVAIVSLIYVLFWLLVTDRLKWLNRPWLYAFGMLTYPLYLLHETIGFLLFEHFATMDPYAVLAGISLFMLALSGLVYRLVERPFSRPIRHAVSGLLNRIPPLNSKR